MTKKKTEKAIAKADPNTLAYSIAARNGNKRYHGKKQAVLHETGSSLRFQSMG